MRAPVSRWTKPSGSGKRRSGRRASTRASRAPSSTGARPRRTVSTSGSSGMAPCIGRCGLRAKSGRVSSLAGGRVGARAASAVRRRRMSATFGYRDVDPAEKPGLVRGVFDRVAAPLRPDERPDERGRAPALEGRRRRPAQSAARRDDRRLRRRHRRPGAAVRGAGAARRRRRRGGEPAPDRRGRLQRRDGGGRARARRRAARSPGPWATPQRLPLPDASADAYVDRLRPPQRHRHPRRAAPRRGGC